MTIAQMLEWVSAGEIQLLHMWYVRYRQGKYDHCTDVTVSIHGCYSGYTQVKYNCCTGVTVGYRQVKYDHCTDVRVGEC